MTGPRASMVILAWNGREHLARCLPAALRAVEVDGGDHEVLVVDNGSPDGSGEFVDSHFAGVRVIRLPENRGIAGGFNAGVRAATREIVVTLCQDIAIEEGFLKALLPAFREDDVFAVSAKRLWPNRVIEHLHLRVRIGPEGLFEQVQPGVYQPDGTVPDVPTVTCYAPLANSAHRRDRFLELGGFEAGFGGRSNWWAEADLSYRAWKRGWRVLYEPRSVALHMGPQTRPLLVPPEEEDVDRGEGWLLLTWGNVTDPDLLGVHLAALPDMQGGMKPWVAPCVDVVRLLAREDVTPEEAAARVGALPAPEGVSGFWPPALWRALPKLPRLVARRREDRTHQRRTDREVLALVGA